MKIIFKISVIFSILFLLIFISCKKYPEGPCISFRSAKSRIYGDHMLTVLTDNGVDELSQYYDSLGTGFQFNYDDFSKVDACSIHGETKLGWSSDLVWTWDLTNDNKILKITSSGGYRPSWGPFGTNILPEWEILRLTKKEIKLKTTYNGKEYDISLKAK